ncbi:MAG TPA: sugar ABC transporter substrate-binding protein [Candidatus Limnocylindrales bacterium]
MDHPKRQARRLGLLASFVVTTLVVSACSSSSATLAPSESAPAAATAAGSTSGTGATAAAGGSWDACKAFSGTTLNFIGEATTQTDVLKALLGDFQTQTGITVNVEEAPYDNVIQKLVLDFTTHKAGYDVFSMPYEYLGSFVENKYIVPIDDYLNGGKLAAPGFDKSDIVPALWKASSNWKDHYYGMPSESPVMMMFYRKDLFSDPSEQSAFKAKYGYDLAPAQNWTQYRDIAEFFTRKTGDKLAGQTLAAPFYGVAIAGKRHIATTLEYFNYMWTMGGNIFDSSGNLVANSAANVKALQYMTGLTQFAPPGYTSYTWDEVTSAFQQGTAAEAITWGDTAGAVEDPSQSKVPGKMGYASIPVDPAVNKVVAHFGGWQYAINADSKNQDAAYCFMEWATTHDVQVKIAQGGGLPSLTSVFQDQQLASSKPYWSQELTSLSQSVSRPRIAQWGGINNVLMLDLSRALAKEITPQQALDDSQTQLQTVMKGALPVTYQ